MSTTESLIRSHFPQQRLAQAYGPYARLLVEVVFRDDVKIGILGSPHILPSEV